MTGALVRLARHGMPLMAAAMLLALIVPALASLARPALEAAVLLMLTIALVRLDWSALATYCRRPGLATVAAAWLLLISPLLVWAALGALSAVGMALPAALVAAMIINAGAPPITAATSFAQMLGLDAALAVFVTVATMLLLPLTLAPILLWLIGLELAIDLATFYARIAFFIGVPFVAAWMLRRIAGEAWVERNGRPVDGIMVLVLIVFVTGVMDGATARILTDPQTALLYVTGAFVLNAGFNLAGILGFWWMGQSAAYAMGLASGSRNMALMVAIAGGVLGQDFLFYTAVAQLPIYLMPLIGLPLYRRLTQARSAA